jgi:DNA-binding transcriptional LysR family regulator
MDIRSLRHCVAIAQLGSFTRAAEALHVAQPALSVSIKKLEEELGVALFVRNARKVVPTVEGAILLKRAERIFAEMDYAKREIEDSVELRSGVVNIGMPPMFGQQYFPQFAAKFHAVYPGLTIHALEGSADETVRRLDGGAIDLALLENRRVHADWRQVLIGTDEMVLCISDKHPLAKRKKVTGQDLDGLPMLLLDGTFIQRSLMDKFCEKARAKPKIVMQSNSVPLLRQAAVDGLGAATLLRSLATATPGLAAISLDPPEVLRFTLCWRNDRYLSNANRALVDFATAMTLDVSN